MIARHTYKPLVIVSLALLFILFLAFTTGLAATEEAATEGNAQPAETAATETGTDGEEKPPTMAEILARAFPDFDGAFVLHDLAADQTYRHNAPRSQQRLPPYSTFKIPHTLIALELGVIADVDAVRPWDQEKHPPQTWWTPGMRRNWGRDQSLRTAFQFSAVWFYKDLAAEIGAARMSTFLKRFDYGNQDISGPLDRFWLGSSLAISADEQVTFLRAFLTDQLDLAASTTARAKEILVLEERSGYRLSGKTGSGKLANGSYLGWSVGYLERDGNTYIFAVNFERDTFAEVSKQRIAVAKRAFAGLGLLREAP